MRESHASLVLRDGDVSMRAGPPSPSMPTEGRTRGARSRVDSISHFSVGAPELVAVSRSLRAAWGRRDDLVEIGKSNVAGCCGSSLAHRGAGVCAKRGDLAIRSQSDRISAHRDACQRSLRVVPHQRALQDHAAGMLWLPQRHDRAGRSIGAVASGDNELLRRLPPDDDVAGLSIHRSCPGARTLCQLPQQQDRRRQDTEPPHHQRSLQHLSFQYGDVQGRDITDHHATRPRGSSDDNQHDCNPAGNDGGAAQHQSVKVARRPDTIKYVQRLDKTEPLRSRQRLCDLPQRRRRDR